MNTIYIDLTCDQWYPHSREAVWAAITNAEAIAQWLFKTDFEPYVGKTFMLPTNDIGTFTCTVIELIPPDRMTWLLQSPDIHERSLVVFTLWEEDGGTRLRVRHRGPAKSEHREDITEGWPGKLKHLLAWLDTTEPLPSACESPNDET